MVARGLYLLAEADLDRHAYALLLRGPVGRSPRFISGFQFAEVCRILRADPRVVLLVADRPTPTVRDLCLLLRDRTPAPRLLVVGGSDDDALRRAWSLLRPQGTLSRSAGPAELATAIDTVAHGGRYVDPRWGAGDPDPRSGPDQPRLSPRERELLPLLAMGLKLRQAAERMEVAYKTADTYRTTLFRKLGVTNRVELSRYAIREQILEA